ncbi:MAG TPA: thiamine pyrophosphate-binding protein [Reyranella sp.]|nr:thiamine pyrophosphate-binding protein [Reyranella sp.]
MKPEALAVVGAAGVLLIAHGQTTERTVEDLERLGGTLGIPMTVAVSWEGLTLSPVAGGPSTSFAVSPTAVHIGRVAAVVAAIDRCCEGKLSLEQIAVALDEIRRLPPAATLRFSAMAGAGAMALGVIFGAAHLLSLALIGASAFFGGLLRRALGRLSDNALVQPFAAAALAGVVGAVTVRLELTTLQRLVAVCPCMVLVPGPHLLNGAIDLVRGRITLGLARLTFATVIVLAISTGLLLGLAVGGVGLPVGAPARAAPFIVDLVAAGIAVAAYGTFFSMPWRLLAVPAAIGMAAHALRWVALEQAGASPAFGALLACLLVGTLATPIADRLRLPFAGLAFASVVSLIPGVLLFRMAAGLAALVRSGPAADPGLVGAVLSDAAGAARPATERSSMTGRRNGAQLLVRNLEAQGVEYVFAIPGAKVAPVFDALLDSKIKTIVCRHEQNAAFAAGALGRLTGKAGVVLVTSGPGCSNLATGLATANTEGDPLVAFGGAVAVGNRLKQTHQSMDTVALLRPVTSSRLRSIPAKRSPKSQPRPSAPRSPVGRAPPSSVCPRTSCWATAAPRC